MAQKNDTAVLILSLAITVGLIGLGAWWLLRRSAPELGGILDGGNSASQAEPGSDLSASDPSASAPAPTNAAQTFADVPNAPSGLFSYGGSTSWAPIRGTVDPVIQQALSGLQLRYTDPATGTPGSASGIRMLLENQLAFAQSSRSLTPDEYQAAQQRGFALREVPVAIEGIALIVRPDLNIEGLTLEQVRDIYTGAVTNWSQVGGPDLPITAYSRRVEDGGTVEFFVENVLQGEPLGNNVQPVVNTTQAIREVSNNPGAIYYASAPEVVGQCTTKPIAVGRQSNELIPPYQPPLVLSAQCPGQRNQLNADALQSGQYPLTRRLFVIIKQDGQSDQQAGEAYANALLSDQGQELLAKAGFVRLR